MSELRNQLEHAQQAYRSQRYPGDLAAELLSPPRKLPVRGILATIGFLTAAAAAVALWVALFPIAQQHGPQEVAIAEQPEAVEFIAMPEFPSDVPMIPQAESVGELGAMPTMPSIDLTFSREAESSEELS